MEQLRGFLGRELTDLRLRLARRLDPQAIPIMAARSRADAIMIDDPPPVRAVRADPKDDYLVGLARAADARVIVTGDRHLLDVKRLEPRAMTPRAFLRWLEGIEQPSR